MRIAFTRWRSGGLFNRRSPRKRLLSKKKTSSGFEFVSGLADGASAMPAKWSRPVFSFRFYEGKISRALIVIQHVGGKHCAAPSCTAPHAIKPAGLDDIARPRAWRESRNSAGGLVPGPRRRATRLQGRGCQLPLAGFGVGPAAFLKKERNRIPVSRFVSAGNVIDAALARRREMRERRQIGI
jgi:hypothetical protein